MAARVLPERRFDHEHRSLPFSVCSASMTPITRDGTMHPAETGRPSELRTSIEHDRIEPRFKRELVQRAYRRLNNYA